MAAIWRRSHAHQPTFDGGCPRDRVNWLAASTDPAGDATSCPANDCLIGLGRIRDPARRAEVCARLEDTGRTVVDLTHLQIANFAGNAIELHGRDGPVLALSSRALRALRPEQIAKLERFAELLPLDVPTIELAGGSVRCMLAGVHAERIVAS